MAASGVDEEQAARNQKIFQNCQTEIAGLSARDRQIFVEDTGHYLHENQPQAVIYAVREVLEIVRKG